MIDCLAIAERTEARRRARRTRTRRAHSARRMRYAVQGRAIGGLLTVGGLFLAWATVQAFAHIGGTTAAPDQVAVALTALGCMALASTVAGVLAIATTF